MENRCYGPRGPVSPRNKSLRLAARLSVFSVLPLAAQSWAQDELLADLSLEELARLPVVSVSKTAQPIAEAPAAVFVITNNDIKRSGYATLPEVLRLAPNLHVARNDARNYAISARGFNNVFANKMLVIMDGRTLYSPLFSGVFWDAPDVLLDDVARIEVVSGPGGTVWGANAVNGIINIITRSAADTQGSLLSIGASGEEYHLAGRHGGRLRGGHYRVYAKHHDHDDTFTAQGQSTTTGWQRSHAGFRADWQSPDGDLTLQGNTYSGRLRQFGTGDIAIAGVNLRGYRSWHFDADSTLSLQAYIDHSQRDQPNAFEQHLNLIDFELQHDWSALPRHHIVWGAGYRFANDSIDNDENFAFLPEDTELRWINAFVQDEITLRDNLRLTLGIKLEDSPFTDWESMPSLHLAWEPGARHLLWASLSRAVRSPSRFDRDLYAPSNPPVIGGIPLYVFAGGPDFKSEVADIVEIGYRGQPHAILSWSVTAFHSEFDHLRTIEPNPAGFGFVIENQAEGDSFGVEAWGGWQAADRWRLHAGVVVQEFDVTLKPGSMDISNTTALANGDPEIHGLIRSSHDIFDSLCFDAILRHVGELERLNVPAYTELDLHLTWDVSAELELSITGRNLLDASHPEFAPPVERSEFERSAYAELTWNF